MTDRRQQGQAMVETVVILFVTLLLLLGIIQFGLIYNAKTTLTYAAFEGARAGSLNYADRQAIEFGIARGLAALYSSIEADAGRMEVVEEVQQARDKVYQELREGKFACLERLNPTPQAFNAYGRSVATGVEAFETEKLIPNDHLLYRSALVKSGARVSIQDANLLKIRITYCYPLYIPFVANTIKGLYGLRVNDPRPMDYQLQPAGSFQRSCLQNDRIPLVAQAVIRMQTPAYNDPSFDIDCN